MKNNLATSAEKLADQLDQFGSGQLKDLTVRDIAHSTIHLILTTAYFTGATIQLSKPLHVPKKEYLTLLTQFLAKKFGLNIENAKGSVESNARLYKRYTLIEKCYNHGWSASHAWISGETNTEDSLKALLNKYQNLGMSDLGIEGTKKEEVITATVPEPVTPDEPTPVQALSPKPRNTGRIIFWLTFIIWAACIGYFSLYPEQIPSELHSLYHSILVKISNTEMSF